MYNIEQSMIRLIFIGGFLGAGKTTALTIIAESLLSRGIKVGILTNDQTENLVDTEIVKIKLSHKNIPIEEVTKGCFCCQFHSLIDRINAIASTKNRPEVILAEPVGSCTDLIASVINPIKKYYRDRFEIAPFTVLVEPNRLNNFLKNAGLFPKEVMYIFDKQMEEADIIALNKIDTLHKDQIENLLSYLKSRYPGKPVIALSIKQKIGIEKWINMLFDSFPTKALQHIDYGKYAKGEAKLGWLNAIIKMRSSTKEYVNKFSLDLLISIKQKFLNMKAEIGHLKFIVSTGNKMLHGSLTSVKDEPKLEGDDLSSENEWIFIINVRANMNPEDLSKMIMSTIEKVSGTYKIMCKILRLTSLAPTYPNPPYILRQ